jgi:hypothetical protein
MKAIEKQKPETPSTEITEIIQPQKLNPPNKRQTVNPDKLISFANHVNINRTL